MRVAPHTVISRLIPVLGGSLLRVPFASHYRALLDWALLGISKRGGFRLASALALMAAGLLVVAGWTPARAADTVWKWTDSTGVVHYSDTPVPGAKRMDLKIQTFSSPDARAAAQPATAKKPVVVYKSLEIWKPTPEETVANSGGQVSVRIRVQPDPRPEDALALYLDGARVDGFPDNAEEYELANVSRGTHTLIATITGEDGKRLIESGAVTFYIQQASVAQPPVGPSLKPVRPR